MKRSKRILLCIVATILAAGLLTLSACTGGQSPQGDDLKDFVYNKAGEFYEHEVDDMVDCSSFLNSIAMSSYGAPFYLNNPNENAVFECTVEWGYLIFSAPKPGSQTVSIKSGDYLYWYPQGPKAYKSGATVDIVLTIDESIVGYAVMEFYLTGEDSGTYKARTLKSALLPQIEGKRQSVTENQIKKAVDEIKK